LHNYLLRKLFRNFRDGHDVFFASGIAAACGRGYSPAA
jgi:hypothetical protein